ncbi:MAG: flagellar protein FlaG [Bryobacteraceae bacterium]|jgi:uncharacterized FlaG/YvyC family protein
MNISSVQGAGQPAAPVSAPVPSEQIAQQREVIQAVRAVNEAGLYGQNNELVFAKDPQTRRPIVKVVQRDTNEVVDQIPPERVLQLAQWSQGSKSKE